MTGAWQVPSDPWLRPGGPVWDDDPPHIRELVEVFTGQPAGGAA